MNLKFHLLAAVLLVSVLPAPAAAPTAPTAPIAPLSVQPISLRVLVKNRTATVILDRTVQQVTLEEKAGTGWKPLAVSHVLPGASRISLFQLPRAIPADQVRAVGYRVPKFPARFRQGSRRFDRRDFSNGGRSGVDVPVSAVTSGLVVSSTPPTNSPLPSVIESDIWQIQGKRVFFFNQYRGLQVLDLADPTQPQRLGSLRLPASGDQMYLLDEAGSHVVLLGRSNEKERQGQAALWIIRIDEGVPVLLQELPLEGYFQDSRLIGSQLHVASSTGGGTPECVLTTFELSDPTRPRTLGSLRFPGEFRVLQGSGDHLLLATWRWNSSDRPLHLIQTGKTAPMRIKTVSPRGYIADKFKVGIVQGAIVTITQDFQQAHGSETWVETFAIEGSSTAPLAALELEAARGESLHATRLDGDRLYVVTFRQIDPLFIVDLASPDKPALSGVLEVPGWSTYLRPLGDRLLAVGVEEGRVTASLFGVSDVTRPSLLSRVSLGSAGATSWSEANYDEKAVEYLPDSGLLMVPFESWENDATTGRFSFKKAMQVIHHEGDALKLGQTLHHNFNPRRGSLIADHWVTLSGQELLVHSLQALDPELTDEPLVRLPLSWTVDRVVPVGDYLVQVEDGPPSYSHHGWLQLSMPFLGNKPTPATLRITTASDPDQVLELLDLGEAPILAMTQQGNRLYLAQWITDSTGKKGLSTLVLELATVPPIAREIVRHFQPCPPDAPAFAPDLSRVQALWPSVDRLVWHVPARPAYFWWWDYITILSQAPIAISASSSTPSAAPAPQLQSSTTPVAPLSVQPKVALALQCPVEITSDGTRAGAAVLLGSSENPRQISTAIAQGGFIFFSHDLSVSAALLPRPLTPRRPGLPSLSASPRVASWLQVSDWRSATAVLREPVSVPGQLLGVHQADAQGAILLTQSDLQLSENRPIVRVIQASAYDGLNAWQLDSYITSTPIYSASATDGTRLYLVRETGTPSVVAIGYQATTGRLAQLSQWPVSTLPWLLHVSHGHLLASGQGSLEIASVDASNGSLKPVAAFDTPANLFLHVDQAAFTSTLDLWVPAGLYGVEFLQRAQLQP